MNRRQFLSTIGATGTILMASNSVLEAAGTAEAPRQLESSQPSTGPVVNGTPIVYAPSDTSATIVWALNRPARGWIEYGQTKDLGREFRSDPFGFVPHSNNVIKLRLPDLKPGTRYWWRAVTTPLNGGEPEFSAIYSFKTLDPTAKETNFAVWSDTHDRAETISKLHALTTAEPTDFLVWNGDISNNIETPEIIPGLYVHPKKTDLAAGPPVLLSRGNHDVRGLWANRVTEYVDFLGGRSFCAFRSGPLAAIILDTGEDKPDRHPTFKGVAAFEPLIEEQTRWLAQLIQLSAFKTAPFRLAFCHIPLRWKQEKPVDYDQGGFDWFSRRGRDAWNDSLVRWGVQAIVSGHMHSWACLPPTTEFPYAQIVGGGPTLQNAVLIRGKATANELKLVIHGLDGKELHTSVFAPQAS
ncbi:MAG TPA: metallophosphoesterase [Clostridia bacterium]|nr:metallophosphoesterase [Clostridia bacterium]